MRDNLWVGGSTLAKDSIKTTLIFLLIVVIGVLCALSLYFYQIFYKSDYYLPGVQVNNLVIEGLNRQDATQLMENSIDNYLNTILIFSNNNYQYEVKLNQLCDKPDIKTILDDIELQEEKRDIYSKLINLDGSRAVIYPLSIDYDFSLIDAMIAKWNSDLATEYINASLEVDSNKGLIVIPGQSGNEVDVEQTLANLPRDYDFNLRETTFNMPIILKEHPPTIDSADLQNMGELASYTTWYKVAEVDRTHNLNKAAQSINGTVIPAGGVFSFNGVVGPRTYELGYRDAMVIIGGIFEPGLGGGICQVSSTIYNAVLLAGLDIVERHNHSLAVAYIPLGRDATVAYGIQDFKFSNNTNSPIYIRALATGGNLTVTIYGDIYYRQKIEISNAVDLVTPFSEIIKVDNDLSPGTEKVETNGIPGYVVRTFRTFFDQNGNKVKTENLATDRYIPLNKLILVGPGGMVDNPGVNEQDGIIENDIINDTPADLRDLGEQNLEGETLMDPTIE